jgi:multidrug resistance efflux pump
MSRRTIVALVVAVVAVVAGAWLLSGGRAPGAEPSPSATLPPVPPSTSVVADARVVPVRAAELAAPATAGTVAEVLVEEGEQVVEGAPLVRFETTLAAADVAVAQAAVDAATGSLAQAQAAAAQAAEQLEAAEASVDGAQAGVRAADAQRDATPAGTTARRAANAEVDRARAALDGARDQRDAARRGRDVALRAADVAAAEVARAQAAFEQANAALAELTVTAPFGGVVASVDARVGETVAPGTIVARVMDPSGWRFETTDLDETAVGRIAPGASATVSLDAFPDASIESRVASIAPFGEEAVGDILYTVVLEPTGELPDGLRWNMTASATIDATAAD